jgi:hypothetical protein
MWLFTRYGFYSIACARKPDNSIDPNLVMIRARILGHLKNLQKRFHVLAEVEVVNPASPQGLLSLLVYSMEKPLVGGGPPVLPQSVRLDDPGAFELVGRELEQLGVQVELVKRLPALREFKKIIEHDFFSRQKGYAGKAN